MLLHLQIVLRLFQAKYSSLLDEIFMYHSKYDGFITLKSKLSDSFTLFIEITNTPICGFFLTLVNKS